MNKAMMKRCLVVGAFAVLGALPLGVYAQSQQYHVAACDWMMLKRQKIGEFSLAKDIGADGIEMDMGPLGQRPMFDNKLRDKHFQQLFRHTADSLGIKVHSMAMSGFFAQSLLKRENYLELIGDCLQSMEVMGAKVAFLPLGGSGQEWKQEATAEHAEMVKRLRNIGDRALGAGKVVAIRTGLDASRSLRLLKAVGSSGIRIYYNLQDAVDQGLDPCKELQMLGAGNIAQIHASLTDSVTLDEDPRIDLRQVKHTLDSMGWSGWLVVERSRNAQDVRNVRGNFGRNVAYLKEIFQGERKKTDNNKSN